MKRIHFLPALLALSIALFLTTATASYLYSAERGQRASTTAVVCVNGETRPCGTDMGECVAGVQTCINGAWGPCEGEVGPTAELCDGLDNDCDGVVDSLLYDDDGEAYCISVVTENNQVGQDPLVTVMAYHEAGIGRFIQTYIPTWDIWLNTQGRNGVAVTEWCNGAKYCQSVFSLPALPYAGSYYVGVHLEKRFQQKVRHTFEVPVVCPGEYCPPDPVLADFFQWMRQKGYYECVVAHYAQVSTDYVENAMMKFFLETRPAGLTPPINLNVYDIIPTDTEATYLGIGANDTRDCQYNPTWTDFCPDSVPADYIFLEQYFERTFGMEFNFNYIRRDIDYSDWFGEPELIDSLYYRFGSRDTLLDPIEDRAIVHFAIQSWKGMWVGDMTGGSRVATSSFEPWNLVGTTAYTHEWGHTLGLIHSFHGTSPRVFFALDGIMANTYGGYNNYGVLDPLDPMERYALEPTVGYTDDATFYADYSAGSSGGYSNWVCGTVDPAILGVTIARATASDTTYRLQLTNYGDMLAGFVNLRAYRDGLLYEERVLPYLPSDSTVWHELTIANPSSGPLRFVLDEDDVIDEVSEANNVFAQNVLCGDINADGAQTSADIIYLVNFVFKGGPPPLGAGDVNNTGAINSADIIYYVTFVFKGGPPPLCG